MTSEAGRGSLSAIAKTEPQGRIFEMVMQFRLKFVGPNQWGEFKEANVERHRRFQHDNGETCGPTNKGSCKTKRGSWTQTFMGLVNATPMQEIGESIDDIVLFSEGTADITADIHRPVSRKPAPILIYIHGGAWVSGSSKTHRPIGFGFARHGYLVFNINYRLAPEYPFPTPFEDCVAAIRWVVKNAAKYGGDASRIAIGGDSAGGNLSAAAARCFGR